MQIYFHSCLCSYLSRVPILVEDTVIAFHECHSLNDCFLACDTQSSSMRIECDSMLFEGKSNKPGSGLENNVLIRQD